MSAAATDFIRQRFVLEPLPFAPDIALYRPTPNSGLFVWLTAEGRADIPPYWAYAWAGGAALALYLRDHPEVVSGKTVLDFGAGSGLVGIAAAKAGAIVTAFEPDILGQAATALNAEANGVTLAIAKAPVDADIVLAGDVFYDAEIAAVTLPILEDMATRGRTVLVGDPFRRHLPLAAMDLIAEYNVPDMGGADACRTGVFTLGALSISDMPWWLLPRKTGRPISSRK